MTRPDFPEYIDSTMRSAFVSCPRKFFHEYMLNRRSGGASVHLVAGKAFASGLEEARFSYFRDGNSSEQAILDGTKKMIEVYTDPERFSDHNKNLPRMLEALDAYFEQWGWDQDMFQPYRRASGEPAIEFSFSLPLEGTAHPVTGAPMIYCGRCDWLGVHQGTGDLYAVDEKTTISLWASWSEQWKHRGQLTGYVWAGQQYGLPVRGALVRGISILKTKFGHAESIQLRTDVYIERWLDQIKRDIQNMIRSWEAGEWDYNFSDSCNSFSSPCPYTDVCASSRPDDYLRGNFEHLRWNPLEHQVEELDDDNNIVRIVE